MILDEISHLPQLTETFLSLKMIGLNGMDFVGKNGSLEMANGKIRLSLKGDLFMCGTYHDTTSFETRFVAISPPTDVAAKAVIAPGNPRPSKTEVNVSHVSYAYDHERLLRATARNLGSALAEKMRACERCALSEGLCRPILLHRVGL